MNKNNQPSELGTLRAHALSLRAREAEAGGTCHKFKVNLGLWRNALSKVKKLKAEIGTGEMEQWLGTLSAQA